MAEYLIRPKPPYTWEDLELEGANYLNAEVVKVVNGEVVARYPYTPLIERRFRPKYERSIYAETVMYVDDKEIPLEKVVYENAFRSGCSPFKQAVVMAVSRGANTVTDVVKFVLDELRILKRNRANEAWLRKLIGWMTKEDYLVLVDGVLKIGIRRLPLGGFRVPIRKGYNPVLYEILEAIKLRGTATKSIVASYVITNLNWIENDPVTGRSAREQLDAYLKYLVRHGHIEVVGGRYRFVRPLEPY